MNSDTKSSLKNKIFYSIFFLLLAGSIVATYVKIVVNKNYQIVAETSCDPATEQCFVWNCDVEIDGECSDNPEENIWIYKIVNKKAATIAVCEASAEKLGCDGELSCTEGEKDCSYKYCDEESVSDGIRCSTFSDVEPISAEMDILDTPSQE
jgi:hypothetical protein